MSNKEELYEQTHKQIVAVLEGEKDLIAKMANTAAILQENFHFWWTGFYRVQDGELILGPFQGPLACMHIAYGKGVCGSAWQAQQTIVVPDVHQFPGHIACSSASQSEIVVPIFKNNEVIAILDIDSEHLGTFDNIDRTWLEKIIQSVF